MKDAPSATFAITPDTRVYVAGHRGLAGSSIWRGLERAGVKHLIGRTSRQLNLCDRQATAAFIRAERPDVIIDAAAKVGGILANSSFPAEFLSENLQIQLNLMDGAHAAGVERFLFLGSSCIYPKFAEQPIREESLLTGPLEPTNDAYAIAKIAGIKHIQAMRTQYGRAWISAMPTNMYGPGDNFDATRSHVLPALIRRFHEAAANHSREVVLWGTGTPMREFLHVDDLASAVIVLLERFDDAYPINVGAGYDVSIRELAETVADVVGFTGEIVQDTSKPDGTPRKLLDSSRLQALGWQPSIGLRDGIASTYRWFVEHHADHRLSA